MLKHRSYSFNTCCKCIAAKLTNNLFLSYEAHYHTGTRQRYFGQY